MCYNVPKIKMKQVEPNNYSLAVQEMSKDLSKLDSSQEYWVSRRKAANNQK